MSLDEEFKKPIETSIGKVSGNEIFVHGHNLTGELMGELDVGSMLYLVVRGEMPAPEVARLFNTVLVALVDYGLSPMALAARLTLTGAPDAIQGALASGILGVGSRFVGVWEDVGRMLADARVNQTSLDSELAAQAKEICVDYITTGRTIPGLGHPFHKAVDPRTARIYAIARETELLGPLARLMEYLREQASILRGKNLVLNPAGACGAVLLDLGFDPRILRGLVAVARAAGIVGHLQEELERPMGPALWHLARTTATYIA
jgi:citrate synthase